MTVRRAEGALQDLREIAEYIAGDSPQVASKAVTRITTRVEQLVRFSASGRRVREFPVRQVRALSGTMLIAVQKPNQGNEYSFLLRYQVE